MSAARGGGANERAPSPMRVDATALFMDALEKRGDDEGALPQRDVQVDIGGRAFSLERVLTPELKWVEIGRRGGLTYTPGAGATSTALSLKKYQLDECLRVPPDPRYMLQVLERRGDAYSCPNNPTTQQWWREWIAPGGRGAVLAQSIVAQLNALPAPLRATFVDVHPALRGATVAQFVTSAQRAPADVWSLWREAALALWNITRLRAAEQMRGNRRWSELTANDVASVLATLRSTDAVAALWADLETEWDAALRPHMPRNKVDPPTNAMKNKLAIGTLVSLEVPKTARLETGSRRRVHKARETVLGRKTPRSETGSGEQRAHKARKTALGGAASAAADEAAVEAAVAEIVATAQPPPPPPPPRAPAAPAATQAAIAAAAAAAAEEAERRAVAAEAAEAAAAAEPAYADVEWNDLNEFTDEQWAAMAANLDLDEGQACGTYADVGKRGSVVDARHLLYLARHRPLVYARVRRVALA